MQNEPPSLLLCVAEHGMGQVVKYFESLNINILAVKAENLKNTKKQLKRRENECQ